MKCDDCGHVIPESVEYVGFTVAIEQYEGSCIDVTSAKCVAAYCLNCANKHNIKSAVQRLFDQSSKRNEAKKTLLRLAQGV